MRGVESIERRRREALEYALSGMDAGVFWGPFLSMWREG
jgi:hypothetical protein